MLGNGLIWTRQKEKKLSSRKGLNKILFLYVTLATLVLKWFFFSPFLVSDVAEPHGSVASVQHLRTGGRWFDPRLGQYSCRGLIIVIATGFIPLPSLSIVSTMAMWESSQEVAGSIPGLANILSED